MNELQQVLLNYWHQFVALLPRLVFALLLLGGIWWLASWVRGYLDRRLAAKSKDPLLTRFLTQMARWAVVLVGLLVSLEIIGLSGIVSGLAAGAGVSAVVVGFAFKDIAENFLAGVILAFNRPFNLGDTIAIQDVMGRVRELNLRTTVIKTFDGKDIFIPNATVLKEKVTNYTLDGYLRQEFVVGIDFEDDVAGATQLIRDELRRLPDVLDDAPHDPLIIVNELAASTVNLKIMFWTDTTDYRRGVLETLSKVMDRVKTILSENGYSLPPDITELRLPAFQKALPIELTVSSQPLPAAVTGPPPQARQQDDAAAPAAPK